MIAADVDLAGAAETVVAGSAGQGYAAAADVRSADSTAGAGRYVEQRFGGLDVLVNNAGIEILGCVDQTAPESWDEIMAVNLRGTYLVSRICCRAAAGGEGTRRRCDRQQRVADGAGLQPGAGRLLRFEGRAWCR